MLSLIEEAIRAFLTERNAEQPIPKKQGITLSSAAAAANEAANTWVKEGASAKPHSKKVMPRGVAPGAKWDTFVDLPNSPNENKPEYPDWFTEIAGTGKASRPDLLVFSLERKEIYMFELTCPDERRIDTSQDTKERKYRHLCELFVQVGWTPHLHTMEVGTRGFVAHSVQRVCRVLGLSHKKINVLKAELEWKVVKCSKVIFECQKKPIWNPVDVPIKRPTLKKAPEVEAKDNVYPEHPRPRTPLPRRRRATHHTESGSGDEKETEYEALSPAKVTPARHRPRAKATVSLPVEGAQLQSAAMTELKDGTGEDEVPPDEHDLEEYRDIMEQERQLKQLEMDIEAADEDGLFEYM